MLSSDCHFKENDGTNWLQDRTPTPRTRHQWLWCLWSRGHCLWAPACHGHSPIISILNWINPFPRIETRLLRFCFYVFLQSSSWPFKSLFSVGFPAKIWKARLPSSTPATCSANFNLLDLLTLNEVKVTNYDVLHREVFSTIHFHPSRA